MGVAAAGAAIGVVGQLAGQVIGHVMQMAQMDKMQKMQDSQNKATSEHLKIMSESLDNNFNKTVQAFGSGFSNSMKGTF
ncbi:hypothetical protein WM04_09345 [Burkholderia ubonensis]|nr:hypothetical protein WM04_09345 [Burkholderia ubonensis]